MPKMKTTLLCLLLLPAIVCAQITVTQSDFGTSGDTIRFSLAQDIWGLDATLGGANVTWDFSVMEPTVQKIDTLFTTAEAGFTYSFIFGNPTDPTHMASWNRLEQEIDFGGFIPVEDVRGFYKKTSTALNYVGAGAKVFGFPLPAKADTIEQVYRFPMNFGDTYTEKRYVKADIPNTFYFEQYRIVENEVEGWGTLITPYGSFQTLKIKKIISEYDSVYVDSLGIGFGINQPLRTEYHWIGLEHKLPLMVYTDQGMTGTIEYQDIIRPGTPVLDVSENHEFSLQMYPNPAHDVVSVVSNGVIVQAALFDLKGRQLGTVQTNATGVMLDISTLQSGLYVVEVLFSGSDVPMRKTLMVAR